MADVKTEADWLLDEMRQLATILHRRCYPHVTQWKPSSTARGILSQIDNMTAGMIERIEKLEAAASWVDRQFVGPETSEDELRKRIDWLVRDVERSRPNQAETVR